MTTLCGVSNNRILDGSIYLETFPQLIQLLGHYRVFPLFDFDFFLQALTEGDQFLDCFM